MCTSRSMFERRVADAGGMRHRDPEKRSQWYFVSALSLEGSARGGGGSR